MASRKDPVARARGRKPAPVKKPFPTGMVAGSTAVVLILGFFLFYAATHIGTGAKGSVANLVASFNGKVDRTKDLSANHVADNSYVNYPDQSTTPPDGGNHNQLPQSCQVYTAAIANEHAVHALEHGAVWVTYNPSLPAAEIATLKKLVDGNSFNLMSPYPGLKSPISLQAWGLQMFATTASDPNIKKFLKDFTSGPQALEPNGTCVGSTDDKATADKTFTQVSNSEGKIKATPTPAPSAGGTPSATPSATAKPSASATPTK